MNIYEKLLKAQKDLKVPKGQFNNFGKYKYRSCEDILEAVKPILNDNKLCLVLSDTPALIGDRYYIEATAKLQDIESTETIIVTASARESFDKKGMDDSQITGTSSSYARKYALNGLFLIDDTKDADTDEHHTQTNRAPKTSNVTPSLDCITEAQQKLFRAKVGEKGWKNDEATAFLADYQITKSTLIPKSKFQELLNEIEKGEWITEFRSFVAEMEGGQ